jgi:hypothetical protein
MANVPELLHFAHLPEFKIHVTSSAKYTIFTFTLLPQIRKNNED